MAIPILPESTDWKLFKKWLEICVESPSWHINYQAMIKELIEVAERRAQGERVSLLIVQDGS